MKLSKTTILEMLQHQQFDMEEFIREINIPYLDGDLREINKPVQLLIAWLSEELGSEAT